MEHCTINDDITRRKGMEEEKDRGTDLDVEMEMLIKIFIHLELHGAWVIKR